MTQADLAPDAQNWRSLNVFSNGRLVGRLIEHNDIWGFAYEHAWVSWEGSWDISPALSRNALNFWDGSTVRTVQWFFDNLLPEEGMRRALAGTLTLNEDDAFSLLEYLGAESAGSLVLLSPDKEFVAEQGMQVLTDDVLSARIESMPQVPMGSTSPKRMSLAGAQHKLLVSWDGQTLSEPLGSTPSTHILKPESPDPSYPHSAINEYAMMTLATRMGLDVPRVWRHYCPKPVYIVERFDREGAPWTEPGSVQRLHTVDTCQLLNKSRTFKYTQATLDSLSAVVEATRAPAATRMGLYRWLVFNLLIGNEDNHLKNISLMVGASDVRLAKTYDLLSTAVYHTEAMRPDQALWPQLALAIPLPGQGTFANVNRAGVLAAGAALGIPAPLCVRELNAQLKKMEPLLDVLIDEIQTENIDLREDAKVYTGGEMRLLRAIRHVVVAQMVECMKA